APTPAQPAPAPARPAGGGSTLFERMTSLSRSKPAAPGENGPGDEDEGSALSIPRFLNRQNNQ
ncbi:cell division protein FtsZ, partial [Novosphingobium sp. 1949]|nr:cell division protein FtsZ [Novosphingobium organovorum]